MVVSTSAVINKLDEVHPEGLQLSCRMGALISTSALYKKDQKIYLFKMEDDFIFKKNVGYEREEFLSEFLDRLWTIEMIIS